MCVHESDQFRSVTKILITGHNTDRVQIITLLSIGFIQYMTVCKSNGFPVGFRNVAKAFFSFKNTFSAASLYFVF